jgi:cytochrome P450
MRGETYLIGFGMDFESVKSENQPLATAYHHLFEPGPTTRLTVLFWYLIPGFKYLPISANKALQNARSTIQNAALGMIRAKQAQETDNDDQRSRDILGVMIEENRKNREAGMMNDVLSEDEMVNQIMTFLAAG